MSEFLLAPSQFDDYIEIGRLILAYFRYTGKMAAKTASHKDKI